jgi:hypothetical protein
MAGLTIIGLVLIVIGWVLQVFFTYKGDKEINLLFLICYALGTLVLAMGGFFDNSWLVAILNLLTTIGAISLIKKIGIKK